MDATLSSKIWDKTKISNFGNYSPKNSPVRNNLKTYVSTSIEVEYNGKEFDLASIYPDALADGILSATKADSGKNYTDVGEYKFNVSIDDTKAGAEDYLFDGLDESVRSATVTVKIVPAKISIMGTIPVTEYGVLKDGIDLLDLTDGLYNRDLDPNGNPDGAPVYALEYRKLSSSVWTTNLPTVSGDYYVRAKITNSDTCNYVLDGDGQVKFTMPKQNVAVPYFTNATIPASAISGTVTTVPYTGDYQVFKLVNSADGTTLSGVSVGTRTGSNGNALTYNQLTGEFRAKEVGTYTVTVSLADGGANTRWANYQNTDADRIITIVITKAELNVTILNSSVTSWQKGEVDAITAYVTGIKNDEKVKVKVTCGPTNGEQNIIADEAMTQSGDTITIKVNLAAFAANQSYKMQISLAEGVSANENYTLNTLNTSFDFFILTAVIDKVDVVWTYDNIIAGYGKPLAEKGQVDYNGQPYEVKLDGAQLPNGIITEYKHEKQNASGTYEVVDECKNAGLYKTTVTISTEAGYELSGSVSTVATIEWEIKAIEFDLNTLVMADNPQWTGRQREISIANAPDWMNIMGTNNRKVDVGTYTVTWRIDADENHTLVGSGTLTNKANVVDNYGVQATLTYEWEVVKAVIAVSNSSKQWVYADKVSADGKVFKVAVPDVYEQYGSVDRKSVV